MDAAISYAVSMQEFAGLDVADRREWRVAPISASSPSWRRLHAGGESRDGRAWTVVTEKLAPREPGFIAAEARFLKDVARVATKITLPAPGLLGERLWDAERSKKAYPRRDDFVRDCVAPLRREIELIRDIGIDIVQIDDPHCACSRSLGRSDYEDPDRAADFAVEMTNGAGRGFTESSSPFHLLPARRGGVRGEKPTAGTYGPILPQLNRRNVQHMTMEFTAAGRRRTGKPRPPARGFRAGTGRSRRDAGPKEDA